VYQTSYTGRYLASKRAVIWIFTSVEELRLKFGPGYVRGAGTAPSAPDGDTDGDERRGTKELAEEED